MKKAAKAQKPKRAKPASRLEGTLNAWAVQLNMESRTLEKKLKLEGILVEPHKMIDAAQIMAALMGDDYIETVRNKRLDAEKKEREEKLANGEIIAWEWVEKELARVGAIWIQALDAAPDTVSREWVEKSLKPAIRTQLEKPKTGK